MLVGSRVQVTADLTVIPRPRSPAAPAPACPPLQPPEDLTASAGDSAATGAHLAAPCLDVPTLYTASGLPAQTPPLEEHAPVELEQPAEVETMVAVPAPGATPPPALPSAAVEPAESAPVTSNVQHARRSARIQASHARPDPFQNQRVIISDPDEHVPDTALFAQHDDWNDGIVHYAFAASAATLPADVPAAPPSMRMALAGPDSTMNRVIDGLAYPKLSRGAWVRGAGETWRLGSRGAWARGAGETWRLGSRGAGEPGSSGYCVSLSCSHNAAVMGWHASRGASNTRLGHLHRPYVSTNC